MFWTIVIVLCLLAIAFVIWPLWRESHRLTPLIATVIVLTVALSAGLYDYKGSPGVPSGRSGAANSAGELPGMQDAVAVKEMIHLWSRPGLQRSAGSTAVGSWQRG